MFASIGSAFTLGTSATFLGSVIASHGHFHLVSASAPLNLSTLFTGRVGADNTDTRLFPHRLSELPLEVLNDPTWPLTDNNGRVLILNRADVRKVRIKLFSMQVIIRTDQFRVKVMHAGLSRHSIREILTDMKWC